MALMEKDEVPVRLKRAKAPDLSITRHRAGKGFTYRDRDGNRVTDAATLARIRSLAIPPAYADVRIAADSRAHLQAVGHDEAGRVQHRYHPGWEKVRERRKLKRLKCLLDALPKLRAAIAHDLKDETYAKTNGSHGASTLLKRHVTITGGRVELSFKGKSGKQIACAHVDPALVRALTRIMTLPGKRLLQYVREDGEIAEVRASEINAYLKRVSGLPVSAKDLRMLAANAAAAELLLAGEAVATETGKKRQLADIMRAISERLVNTPAVVRKSYVHAIVLRAYATGRLKRCYERAKARGACSRIELALGLVAA
jgi:DNA topoisomerase-1